MTTAEKEAAKAQREAEQEVADLIFDEEVEEFVKRKIPMWFKPAWGMFILDVAIKQSADAKDQSEAGIWKC